MPRCSRCSEQTCCRCHPYRRSTAHRGRSAAGNLSLQSIVLVLRAPGRHRFRLRPILLPSGENDGVRSSAAFDVSRDAVPSAMCCTQISRLPSPLRSDANATNFPSGERPGSVLSPPSDVSRGNINSADTGERLANQATAAAVMATPIRPAAIHAIPARDLRGACAAAAVRPDSISALISSSRSLTSTMC